MDIDENSLARIVNRKLVKVAKNLCIGLMSLVFISSCSKIETNAPNTKVGHPLQINFRHFYGDQEIGCNSQFTQTLWTQEEVGRVQQREWQIDRFGFYISDIYLGFKDKKYKLKLAPNRWQSESLGLIWFAETCKDSASSNQVLRVKELGEWREKLREDWRNADSLELTLGVPFAENHKNPLSQASPLNLPEMFWSWRNGHKFLRLDMTSVDNQRWSFHLGSVGCSSASSLRPPEKQCLQHNRVTVKIDLSKSSQIEEEALAPSIEVALDLAHLLSEVSLEQEERCMFDYSQQSQCSVLMSNLVSRQVFRLAEIEAKSK